MKRSPARAAKKRRDTFSYSPTSSSSSSAASAAPSSSVSISSTAAAASGSPASFKQLASPFSSSPSSSLFSGVGASMAASSHSHLPSFSTAPFSASSLARGLDVLPATISRFRNGGDECTANLLETVVFPEEITHCAAGVKWFTYLSRRKMEGHQDANTSSEELPKQEAAENRIDAIDGELQQPVKNPAKAGSGEQNAVMKAFHDTVRRYFRGPLKPPFNVEARKAAGFEPSWYEPLAFRPD